MSASFSRASCGQKGPLRCSSAASGVGSVPEKAGHSASPNVLWGVMKPEGGHPCPALLLDDLLSVASLVGARTNGRGGFVRLATIATSGRSESLDGQASGPLPHPQLDTTWVFTGLATCCGQQPPVSSRGNCRPRLVRRCCGWGPFPPKQTASLHQRLPGVRLCPRTTGTKSDGAPAHPPRAHARGIPSMGRLFEPALILGHAHLPHSIHR